jgi:hypothetical protein
MRIGQVLWCFCSCISRFSNHLFSFSGFDHILLCYLCDEDKSSSYLTSFRGVLLRSDIQGNLSEEFPKNVKPDYCIHCRAIEQEDDPIKEIVEEDFPWHIDLQGTDVEVLQEEPMLVAVIAAQKLGVIGRCRKGAKPRCYTCNGNKGSKGCVHLKLYASDDIEEPADEMFKDIDENGRPIIENAGIE